MKKNNNRLALRKITLADISPNRLAEVGGGLQKAGGFTKESVCAEMCCATDINAQCRTK